ncbi:MAG: DUF1559 domain-containing protein [Planctomycetaceae bacterium]|nr:DUF1559 domain-containing protein [Planctomycetaceae bacterium]
MKHQFFFVLLAVILFAGCNNSPQQTDPTAEIVDMPTLGVPLPSAEMLAALGPENNLPIQRMLADPIFVIAAKPKQFLNSPVCTDAELLVRSIVAQGMQLPFLNFDPNDVEFFVQSNGLPFPAQVIIPNPQNPQDMLVRTFPVIRRSTVITFAEPFNLSTLLGSPEEIAPEILESVKRTEGRNEYYDLTPPDEVIPQFLALSIIDDRTVVIAQGIQEDIKSVFSDSVSESAVLQRLKHTPVDARELAIIASVEGLAVSPEVFEVMVEQAARELGVPHAFISLISQHLRAMTLSLNVSAPDGEPMISVFVEARNEQSAETIGEAIQGMIINAQTTVRSMMQVASQSDAIMQRLPIPYGFAIALLDATSTDVADTQVHVSLNNFSDLIPTVADGLRNQQVAMVEQQERWEQEQLQNWLADRLEMFAHYAGLYYAEHGKFPTDILGDDGTPLLSWRVALLPTMGLSEWHDLFKLDEPWNSEANLEALQTVPNVFMPGVPGIGPTQTIIRYFDSPGAPLSNRDLKLEDLEHPQTTLLFVLVSPEHAVEWTQPASLEFDVAKIADIFGDFVLGVSFSNSIIGLPIISDTSPAYGRLEQLVEAVVKGLALPDAPE